MYCEDEDESSVHITRQHHELLKIELLDAGFSATAIDYAFGQCTDEQLELCANFAASTSFQNKSFAALISDREMFIKQLIAAIEYDHPVLQDIGHALLHLQQNLRS
jgi:uncharacterized protein (DUF433 family)